MTDTPTIFVQIAAYRDAELAPTLADLFAKAAHPDRVFAGVCWQYKAGEDPEKPALPAGFEKQVRLRTSPVGNSEGPSWAKRQTQQLYKDEDYVLMIDSHMRFVKGWDDLLIEQLAAAKSAKPVITHLPPGYTPPDKMDLTTKLTVLRAHYPTTAGDIRFRGEQLDRAPDVPLRGAFAAPGFLFAKGALISEVPCDPYIYFDQEEMCFSARLFTHGWDVHHPSKVVVYHLYDSTPAPHPRPKHWEDNPRWTEFNRRGRERADHLLGVQLASSEAALQEIDMYGHGDARSLDEYAAFCGINFTTREVTARAFTCGFIAGLEKYRSNPIAGPQAPAAQAPASDNQAPAKQFEDKLPPQPAPTGRAPRPSVYSMKNTEFTPKSLDILNRPVYVPPGIVEKNRMPLKLSTEGLPPGVLVIDNYASEEVCQYLRDHADRTAGVQLKVVDSDRSTSKTVVTKVSDGRITEYVSINAVVPDILGIFNDIYWHRLAPYFGVTFEWYERPQILRYPVGGKYNPHADAEHLNTQTKTWLRSLDRDISVLLYLNEGYEGGALSFDHFNFKLQPRSGMLLAFPSDHRYLHAALPTTKGIRYVIVSWAATVGSPRVKDSPPYASTMFHLPN